MEHFRIETPARLDVGYVTRPRGNDWLDDDLKHLSRLGNVWLCSALERSEALDLGLGDEERAARRVGIRFVALPIPDRTTPDSMTEFGRALLPLQAAANEGAIVRVHCRQSIGRASLILGALLCHLGLWSEESGWERMAAARGRPVPDTSEQREWLQSYFTMTRSF